jgi:hypothetical protein
LEGGLFPEFMTPFHDSRTSQSQTQQMGISFVQFLVQTSPESASDYAKLMIWSFLAGFAERLVHTQQRSLWGASPSVG